MYNNILLMRNGCNGCSEETCLGVLLADAVGARVTAVYVTDDLTWQELRQLYGPDELKWPGAARAGKEAEANARRRKADSAREALDSVEKMCATRGVPCETVELSTGAPTLGLLTLARERRCDLILGSTHAQGPSDLFSDVIPARNNGKIGIPVMVHHSM